MILGGQTMDDSHEHTLGGIFQEYFKEIKNKYKNGTEFTPRTDLENLLNKLKTNQSIHVFQEPKKKGDISGKPDFRIEFSGVIIGYIETKTIGANLEDIINPTQKNRDSEQLEKYLRIKPNLILTNYNEFILFKTGKPVDRFTLFYLTDDELNKDNIEKISKMFKIFFMSTPQKIKKPEKLSELLAERTIVFRDFLKTFLEKGNGIFKEKLIGENSLYQLFKDILIEDLESTEFIDAYVQTITYGLFLAKLKSKEERITKENALQYIPKSIGTLKELFKTMEIEDIPDDINWIIDEIINILNNTLIEELEKNLSFSKTYNYVDPYVYFYENFLEKYDNKKRKKMGVYYTHIPVVRFIIRSIDYLIKKDFKKNGLKDSDVTLLDFATGTGTFLLEAFKIAIDETDEGLRRSLIKEHLLKNFFGFEYLIAPYTIAHLKISQFLQDNDYILEDEKLKIYLTDTLDGTRHKIWAIFPTISEEGIEANKIKLEEKILVITGNPPYSNYSKGGKQLKNKQFIDELINDYKKGLDEKKINLDDDYIKFLRYAHWKIENTNRGIIGIITNNSYIDGITHWLVRKKLLETFDKIYILNLHGNSSKGEPDENIFKIKKVGVAIALFVKYPQPSNDKEIYYYSSLENNMLSREEKFDFLLKNNLDSINWTQLNPKEPDYWFVHKDLKYEKKYEKGFSLKEIFKEFGSGIKTDRDELFIDFEKSSLSKKIIKLLDGNLDKDFMEKYNVADSSSYPLLNRIKGETYDPKNIEEIQYRPFDFRYIYYKLGLTSRPAYEIMQHLMKNNIALISVRQIAENTLFTHAFISDKLVDLRITLSNRGTAYVFPLYLYTTNGKNKQASLLEKQIDNPYKNLQPQPNFTDDFINFLIKKYPSIPTPENIFAYIYAILHSPIYRTKYHEFLKTNFPRIFFTDDVKKFKKLAQLGNELMEHHLLKKNYGKSSIGKFPTSRKTCIIEKIRYDEKSKRIYINDTQYFDYISEEIWNFKIGGYQVLSHWLKEREKGKRNLSYEEIIHFQKMIRVINDTLPIMERIDNVVKNF